MNIKTVHMKDLFKCCDDIYAATMIISQRAKQIIDDRVVPIDENEEVEDSIEFEEPVIITYEDKPESIALDEFLKGELEWRKPSEDRQSKNES